MSGTDREIGVLQAQVKGIMKRLDEVHGDVKAMRSTIDQAKGGWKGMVAIAGLASATTLALGKMVTVLGWLPK